MLHVSHVLQQAALSALLKARGPVSVCFVCVFGVGRLSCAIIILSERANHILVLISYHWREKTNTQERKENVKRTFKTEKTFVFNMNIYLKKSIV